MPVALFMLPNNTMTAHITTRAIMLTLWFVSVIDPIRLARIGEQRWRVKKFHDTHLNPIRLVRMADKIESIARRL